MIIILGLIILAVVVAVAGVLGNSAHPRTATIGQTRLACGSPGLSGTGAGMPSRRADR
jgi:hypothetical protein